MRAKTPPFKPFETKEERETNIRAFIREALDESAEGRIDAIAVVARSPSSPVMAALLSLSDELAERRIGATIVLAGGATAAEDETWSLSFSARFVHEIRLTANPRILDAHEQLIVGDAAVWFGDCMRRDPDKRDSYSSAIPADAAVARGCRFTFQALWRCAQSIYRSSALTSVVVSTAASVPAEQAAPDTPSALVGPSVGGSTLDTLAAWQPSTRH